MLNLKSILLGLMIPSLTLADKDECKNFNTVDFFETYLKAVELDQSSGVDTFYNCLEKNNGALIWQKDQDGSIPLFKALATEIHPDDLELFFGYIDSEQWADLLNLRDNLGRNAMMVAIEESIYASQLLRLITLGGDTLEVLPDETGLIEYASSIENNESFVAVLLATGASVINAESSSEINDMQALLFQDDWSQKPFLRWFRALQEDEFQNCKRINQQKVLQELQASQLKYCLNKNKFETSRIDQQGNSLLHQIAKYGKDAEMVDLLMTHLSEEDRTTIIKQTNEDGFSALYLAAQYSSESSLVTRLIAWGADPNSVPDAIKKPSWKDRLKAPAATRPLHLAAARRDGWGFDVSLRLIAGGANAFLQDEKGNTALHILLQCPEARDVRDVSKKCGEDKPDTQEIELILEAQWAQRSFFGELTAADVPEIKNNKGATPLAYATTKTNDFWMINSFLFYGASPDVADDEGWTPLLLFAERGQDPDTFESLLTTSKDACAMTVKKGDFKGATVASLLKDNKTLYNASTTEQKYTMALFKEKCPN